MNTSIVYKWTVQSTRYGKGDVHSGRETLPNLGCFGFIPEQFTEHKSHNRDAALNLALDIRQLLACCLSFLRLTLLTKEFPIVT